MSSKEDFLNKVQQTIDTQQSNLEKLKTAAQDETSEAIDDIKAAISQLEPKIEEAKAKALEIADAADDKWDDLKDSVEQSWDEAGLQLEEGWGNLTDSIKNLFS